MNEPLFKVLIVEDSEANAKRLNDCLVSKQAFVTIVKTSEDAISEILNQYFDVALINIGLPSNAGLQLARWLRRYGFAKPMIAITEIPYSQDQALAAGFDNFMVNPWDRCGICGIIEKVMLQKRRERAKGLCQNAR